MLTLSASAFLNRFNTERSKSLRSETAENLLSFTPLMFAAAYRSAKAILVLSQNKAIKDAANETDCYGNTPLGVLAANPLFHNGNFEFSSSITDAVLALIKECGADLNNTLACYPSRSITNKVNRCYIIRCCLLDCTPPALAQALLNNGADFSQSDFLDFSYSYRGIDCGSQPGIFINKTRLSAIALQHILKSSDLAIEGTMLVIKYNKPLVPVDRTNRSPGISNCPETLKSYRMILDTRFGIEELMFRIHEALCVMFTKGEQEYKLELSHEECLTLERATATKNNGIAK